VDSAIPNAPYGPRSGSSSQRQSGLVFTRSTDVACRIVRGFALDEATATDLLWQWCGNRDGWDRSWVAAKIANAARYGTEAFGALV
jgi:hypothetical protein